MQPNLLVLLMDGMQAEVLEACHVCQTPHFDRLAERGTRLLRAHTSCPICSPARASLMTGLLPHNHGVLDVEHARDHDQCVLRTDRPHWAQRLADAGYRTGYFGKWHIERSGELEPFGWREWDCLQPEQMQRLGRTNLTQDLELDPRWTRYLPARDGYNRILHYGVCEDYPAPTQAELSAARAGEFVAQGRHDPRPWCCCLSFAEPNEALVARRAEFERYDVANLPLPANLRDPLRHAPALYRRQQQLSALVSDDQWRIARACYYARISHLDSLCGQLLDQLAAGGQRDSTLVVLLSDHGRYVGAHGFDAHNCGGYEEIYRIPLVAAGPGISAGQTSSELVGIGDLAPTLLELLDLPPLPRIDGQSFAHLLRQAPVQEPSRPPGHSFESGFAEYHGTRFPLMQRILWHDGWKLVFNGFDFDELYQLEHDPWELENRIDDPQLQPLADSLMRKLWGWVRRSGDRTLLESHYYSLRLGRVGPAAADG